MRSTVRSLVAVAAVAVVLVPAAAGATGGEGETWPAFTESSSCGAQRITTAHAPKPGGLPRDFILRGEYGAFFGRTVDQVFDAMVRWPVPGSSEVLSVHPWMVPALERATDGLERSLADGVTYDIDNRTTFSASARTIGGAIRISRHTYGIAMDFNSARNPFRGDNELITDLPDWWVEAFLDAGFCWGGLWVGSKDAMHFAWQGPAFSGYASIPEPLPPLTDAVPFDGSPDAVVRVAPRPVGELVATMLTDVDTNGAADVVRISVDGADVIIDTSVASRRHNACSARRSIAHDLAGHVRAAHTTGFGDWDGRGGNDLWIVEDDDGTLRLTVRWAFGGYSAETTVRTAVPTPAPEAWVSTADVDVDGRLDLVVVDDGRFSAWSIDPDTGATVERFVVDDPYPGATERFLGDIDLDNRPDLMAIVDGAVAIAEADEAYTAAPERHRPGGFSPDPVDIVASDYDGDGRVDLVTFDGFTKRVWLGNTPLADGQALETWFESDEPECRDTEPTWEREEFRFSSSGWVATGSYEWRTRNGFVAGCNPEDDVCPIEPVTRRAFAEFLAWIDGLEPASSDPDRAATRAVELAGYRQPCASGDAQCLDRLMLRTEFAPYFGVFLADRRGDVPPPHRWVFPTAVPAPPERLPN